MNLGVKSGWLFRNMANIITGFGIKLCIILLWIVVFHREQTSTIFLLVSGILLTDFLDGQTARYFKIVSRHGVALDRLRDKLFEFTMFSFFLLDPRVDLILKRVVCPLIAIETLLATLGLLGYIRGADVSSGVWGKAKMLLMSIGLFACPASIMAREWGTKVPPYITQILFWIFVVSFCLAILSFVKHAARYRQQLSAG